MSIQDQLLKLQNSPEFQKRVKAARLKAIKTGKAFGHRVGSGTIGSIGATGVGSGEFSGPGGVGVGGGNADLEDANQKMLTILTNIAMQINHELPSFPLDPKDLFMIDQHFDEQVGAVIFEINFRPGVVHRDSLYEEGYPDGLQNLVQLRSHGSKPSRRAVFNRKQPDGTYKGGVHYYLPKGYRTKPSDFLREAIASQNAQFASDGVRVILNPKYSK